MQVLIADDDPVYQTLLQDLLTEWGYDIVVVGDGAAAWREIQGDNPPSVAILDWLMPGLDGFELCQRIRADETRQDTYIIILTGGRQKEEIIKVLVAGADDYLIKPFEPLDLKIRVRAAQRIVDLRSELAELRKTASV